MTVFNTVRNAIEKRARYMRTKAELRKMPTQTAIDLGLFREDADRIARDSVYG